MVAVTNEFNSLTQQLSMLVRRFKVEEGDTAFLAQQITSEQANPARVDGEPDSDTHSDVDLF
jgi:hypothetical protein